MRFLGLLLLLSQTGTAAASQDTLLVAGRLNLFGIRSNLTVIDALPGPSNMGLAFRHVAQVGGNWYTAAWTGTNPSWGRDTVEVTLKDGRILRAVEQLAMTPAPEARPVSLAGMVATGDLHKLPYKKWGPCVMVWLSFREDFSPSEVVATRARPPKTSPSP